MLDSLLLLLYPFSYEDSNEIDQLLLRWHRSDIKMAEGVFHDYIRSKFIGQNAFFAVYALNKEELPAPLTLLHSSIKGSDGKVSFRILERKESWLGPRLILCPSSKVGLLSIALEPYGKNLEDRDLMHLNSRLQQLVYKVPQFVLNLPTKSTSKKERFIKSVPRILGPIANETDGTWNFPSLVRFLLNRDSDYPLAPRFHIFTYYQLPFTTEQSHWHPIMERIIHLWDDRHLAVDVSTSSTFEDIHFGASVEGGAIVTLYRPENSDFLSNFSSTILTQRYLWIYMLVVLQRTMQLRLVNILSQPLPPDDLSKVYSHLALLRANTWFTDISNFSQHNIFYRQCAANLGIEKLFMEINSKLSVIRTASAMRLEAAQKRMDKDIKEMERRQTAVNTALSIIIGLLTVISVSEDGMNLLSNSGIIARGTLHYRLAALAFTIVSLIFVVGAVIFFGRKKKNRTDNPA